MVLQNHLLRISATSLQYLKLIQSVAKDELNKAFWLYRRSLQSHQLSKVCFLATEIVCFVISFHNFISLIPFAMITVEIQNAILTPFKCSFSGHRSDVRFKISANVNKSCSHNIPLIYGVVKPGIKQMGKWILPCTLLKVIHHISDLISIDVYPLTSEDFVC